MIAKLKGTVDSLGSNWVIIDVNGVGYQLYCDGRTLNHLSTAQGSVTLFAETVLRQDSLTLYGFSSAQDQDFCRLLTTVQGVGMKAALAILSVLSPQEITHAVVTQDKAMITRAEGVGPKLASRIVLELKDKVGAFGDVSLAQPGMHGPAHTVVGDALSALLNLGYRRVDASNAIGVITKDIPDISLDQLIPEALKYLSNPSHRKSAP